MGTEKERVAFQLRAPEAGAVFLAGTFNDWSTDADPMKKDREGVWKKSKKLRPGRHEYKFIVDGVWKLDPACRETARNQYGTANNVIQVQAGSDAAARRDAYLEKMKARLDKWNREIDKLEDKAAQAKGVAQTRYRQQIDALRGLRREFEAKIEEARQAVEQAWDELKGGLEEAWEALSQGIKSAKTKFK
jgi:hypothetical protein